MRKRCLPLCAILSLLAVLLAACAPAETQTKPPAAVTPIIVASTATGISTDALHSTTPMQTAQVIATSRGPNLEATDPKTVSMASGELQFVEFFEFW